MLSEEFVIMLLTTYYKEGFSYGIMDSHTCQNADPCSYHYADSCDRSAKAFGKEGS
jgi:hypothetical protein